MESPPSVARALIVHPVEATRRAVAHALRQVAEAPITVHEAGSLTEAAAAFGDAAKDAFDRTMDDLREMQRQQASSIVVPKGGMDPAGGMGGGNIQLP